MKRQQFHRISRVAMAGAFVPATMNPPVLLAVSAGQSPLYTSVTGGTVAPTISLTEVIDSSNVVLASSASATVTWVATVGTTVRIRQTATNAGGTVVLISNALTVLAAEADIGGWTALPLSPVSGAVSTYISAAQTGGRLYLIAPESGEIPTSQADALDMVLFNTGTALVDRYGNTTQPKAGAKFGLSYGTDPYNPGPGCRMFKNYAMVAPKDSTTRESCYDTVASRILNLNALGFRPGKPDKWLFAGGETLDSYKDMREWLDMTGKAGTAINRLGGSLGTAGGTDSANMAHVGVFRQSTQGRARIIHAISDYGMFAFFGPGNYSPADAMKYMAVTGIMVDGSSRSPWISPVDWPNYKLPFSSCLSQYLGGGTGLYGLLFEDNHFHVPQGNFNFQVSATHTTPRAEQDITFRRNIINDTWLNGNRPQVTVRKTADQTVPVNSTVQLVLDAPPDENIGNVFASNAYTVPAANYFQGVWVQTRVQGTVAAGGFVKVALRRDGVEVASAQKAGTGVAAALYDFSEDLVDRTATALIGTVYTVHVTVSGSSAAASIVGAWTRAIFSRVENSGSSGIFCSAGPASKMVFDDNILLRTGFMVDPRTQLTTFPNGANGWDWNIYNHNIYFVGSNQPDTVFWRRNVSLIGAAGDGFRMCANIEDNFFYQGGVGASPEPTGIPWASNVYTNKVYRNVMQKYKAKFGDVRAHPGWGASFACGARVDFQDNIVSDKALTSPDDGQYALQLTSMSNPYVAEYAFKWANDTYVNAVNNYLDATSTSTQPAAAAISEANGANSPLCLWHGKMSAFPATGDITGTVVTFIPEAGYTGSPTSYQWYRSPVFSAATAVIPGATSASRTLTADDWGVWQGLNYLRVSCVAGGHVYPAGTGVGGNIANNVFMQPAGKAINSYYNMNANGLFAAPSVVPSPPVPATSGLVMSSNAQYATYAAAQSAKGGANWDASLRTYMGTLGTVSSPDGFNEFYSMVLGAVPHLTAVQRGKWPERAGLALVNHVRAGRGKVPVTRV